MSSPSEFLLARIDTLYNDVNEWLTVGGDLDVAEDLLGQTPDETVAALMDHGVTHVLDLRIEWDDTKAWVRNGLPAQNYRYLPIEDSRSHIPADDWFTGVEDFVEQFWKDAVPGDRLYVHCHMGINRAPSAAMLALLHSTPGLSPWEAFMTIREVRPPAGVVYAKYVGIRHIIQAAGGWDGDIESPTYKDVSDFIASLQTYWTPEMIAQARRGVAYYRSLEGGTEVDTTEAL